MKKFITIIMTLVMIITTLSFSACGDPQQRSISDPAEKEAVRGYMNDVFGQMVKDEIDEKVTYTLDYEIAINNKLLDPNGKEVTNADKFEEIVGDENITQSYGATVEAGYDNSSKNFYKRLYQFNEATQKNENVPLEFVESDNLETAIHYDFDEEQAYVVSGNHADINNLNKSISGFAFLGASYEKYLVEDDSDNQYYDKCESYLQGFKERFADFKQVDFFWSFVSLRDSGITQMHPMAKGDHYFLMAEFNASFPYKQLACKSEIEFTKDEFIKFTATLSSGVVSETIEAEDGMYTETMEFVMTLEETREETYDKTKEITAKEKAKFGPIENFARYVEFKMDGLEEKEEFSYSKLYADEVGIPSILADAIDDLGADKEHIELKAYTDEKFNSDAEKWEYVNEIDLDNYVVTSAYKTLKLYLDFEIEEGYAVVLENVYAINSEQENVGELAFRLKVFNIAVDNEYKMYETRKNLTEAM